MQGYTSNVLSSKTHGQKATAPSSTSAKVQRAGSDSTKAEQTIFSYYLAPALAAMLLGSCSFFSKLSVRIASM